MAVNSKRAVVVLGLEDEVLEQMVEANATARVFFREEFAIDVANINIAPDTTLADFRFKGKLFKRRRSSCDLSPEDRRSYERSLEEQWDTWILYRLQAKYGVVIKTTDVKMIVLLDLLTKTPSPRTHH